MEKYYLLACELGNDDAMCYLGKYYYFSKNYEQMKKCYITAADLGNVDAMDMLCFYYRCKEKNLELVKKYSLMLIKYENLLNYNIIPYLEKFYENNKKELYDLLNSIENKTININYALKDLSEKYKF